MKDKNMDNWLKSKCPSVSINWNNLDCVDKLSVCVCCKKGLSNQPQCSYTTENWHCGFPDIAEPLKLAYILLGGSYANNRISF